MEDRFERQLKKGVLEMLVLRLLCQRPAYGYELISRLAEESGGLFLLKEGTLYPILYRLEDEGMVQSTWSAGEGRVAPKKVYTVTEKGLQQHKEQMQAWDKLSQTVKTMLEKEDF